MKSIDVQIVEDLDNINQITADTTNDFSTVVNAFYQDCINSKPTTDGEKVETFTKVNPPIIDINAFKKASGLTEGHDDCCSHSSLDIPTLLRTGDENNVDATSKQNVPKSSTTSVIKDEISANNKDAASSTLPASVGAQFAEMVNGVKSGSDIKTVIGNEVKQVVGNTVKDEVKKDVVNIASSFTQGQSIFDGLFTNTNKTDKNKQPVAGIEFGTKNPSALITGSKSWQNFLEQLNISRPAAAEMMSELEDDTLGVDWTKVQNKVKSDPAIMDKFINGIKKGDFSAALDAVR